MCTKYTVKGVCIPDDFCLLLLLTFFAIHTQAIFTGGKHEKTLPDVRWCLMKNINTPIHKMALHNFRLLALACCQNHPKHQSLCNSQNPKKAISYGFPNEKKKQGRDGFFMTAVLHVGVHADIGFYV